MATGGKEVHTQDDHDLIRPLPQIRPSIELLLGRKLDEVSYQNLEEAYPILAGALQEVVKGGYSPQQIRQWMMEREMPLILARWLEQAARFLLAGGD